VFSNVALAALHCDEPTGRMNLTGGCFALMTERVKRAAAWLCDKRLVLAMKVAGGQ
jgi:hypothetical protein